MRRRKRGKRVLHCPHCGSTEISITGGMILGQVYHCARCDYVGSLVFETDGPPEASTPDDPESDRPLS